MNSKVTRELGYFASLCRCSVATRRTISKLAKKGRESSFLLPPPGSYLVPAHCATSGTLLVLNLVINEADYLILVLPVVEIDAIN